jgi:hypothetical protein
MRISTKENIIGRSALSSVRLERPNASKYLLDSGGIVSAFGLHQGRCAGEA